MRRFKKFLLVLLALIVVIGIGLCAYIFHLKPKYEGEVKLKNLQNEITVYFDDFGVPHIYANSEKDAMTALGYVHAQERLWQMEL
ncbi:penicillin acylase family protein, partial [Flavobacterium sp. LBUM151]